VSPVGPGAETTVRDIEPAARAMGLQTDFLNASTSREIDAAFASFAGQRPDALFVANDVFSPADGCSLPTRQRAMGSP
jgi:hypothetical protein